MEKKQLEPHEIRSHLMLFISYLMLMMSVLTFLVLKSSGLLLGLIVFCMGLGLLFESFGHRNRKQKPDLAKYLLIAGRLVFVIALVLAILFIVGKGSLPF